MDALLNDLAQWIPEAVMLLAGWYLRQNAKNSEKMVESIANLRKSTSEDSADLRKSISDFRSELSQVELRFEKKLDEQLGTVYRRLERLAISTEGRVSSIEGRCSVEHDRRRRDNVQHSAPADFSDSQRRKHTPQWFEESDLSGGSVK